MLMMVSSTSVPSGVESLVSAGEVGALEGAGEVGAGVAGAAGAAAPKLQIKTVVVSILSLCHV